MQGQRDSFQSLPESQHFGSGSNSNNSDMDEPVYQSNLLLNPMEPPTLADFLIYPNEANMDYMTITSEGTDDLGVLNSRDPDNNSFVVNEENHDENKVADGWNTALSISSGNSPRRAGRHSERTNLSFDNVGLNLNLNNTPVDGQAFSQSFNLIDMSQSTDTCADSHANNVESSLCPFIPEFFESESVPCTNSYESSSSGLGHVSEDRERNVGRLVACKRKNMEGVIGEASTSRISADLNIPSSSMCLTSASSLEENQSPNFSRLHRGVSSEWYPPSSSLRNAETLQRNLRARLNLSFQHDVSSLQTHFLSNRLSSDHLPGELSSNMNPFIHPAEESQPHVLPVSHLPDHIHHSPSSSRIANPAALLEQRMRLIAAHEETNQRSLPTNGVIARPTFLARTSVHHLVQDPQNWSSSNSNLSMSTNGVGTSSGFNPLPVSMRQPSEIVPIQYSRMVEAVRSSLFLSGGSESGQITTLPSLHSGRSASTQEPGQSSRAVRQGHSQPFSSIAVPSDRQHGVSPLPLSARSRDRRSRMITEIRNALDLMRRRGNLRFEDIFFFDHSGINGRPDFLDRHRDLRLDVDNMSYEELLALEERIGYVSTGLCEQAILKCLKKQKYSRCKLEVATGEPEPCCICREHYSEGDDIGTLDCRHDFHTACIKQWLMIKNLCPICKTPALVEGHSTTSEETK